MIQINMQKPIYLIPDITCMNKKTNLSVLLFIQMRNYYSDIELIMIKIRLEIAFLPNYYSSNVDYDESCCGDGDAVDVEYHEIQFSYCFYDSHAYDGVDVHVLFHYNHLL